MICTSCHKAQAVVFVKEIINNELIESALCENCASAWHMAHNPQDLLLNLLSGLAAPKPHPAKTRCPSCGLSQEEFQETGRFGCPECYTFFSPFLKTLLPRMHNGATVHRGQEK